MVKVCQDIKYNNGKHDHEGYYLDGYVQKIGDGIVNRVSKRKQDILCIFTGQEGSGKTNASVALAFYVGRKTKRKFTYENVFFDIEKMMKFAGSTKEQIILWDEAALGGLASDWTNAAQRKLKAMLMVCRKKRHVFLFNVPRFYRLNSDIIERAFCMFHIYENDNEEPGNFMFFGRDGLEILYNNWKTKRYAQYWKFKKFHGYFDWVLPWLIDEDKYEAMKDAAILSLAISGEEKPKKESKKDIAITLVIEYLVRAGMKKKEIAKIMDIDVKSLRNWGRWVESGQKEYKQVSKDGDVDDKGEVEQ